MKASAWADKWRRLHSLAEEAETAARNNCTSDLYQLTRKIAGQRRNMTTVKDREGKRLVNEGEVLERWREYFEGVLNVPRPDIPLPEIDQAPEVITSIETAARRGQTTPQMFHDFLGISLYFALLRKY